MFQSFDAKSSPDTGAPRLADLRKELRAEGLAGFFVPRADMHQGEYVPASDQRLAWLTGFTGSAGFCIALLDKAGVFVDGRYRVQVRQQVDLDAFSPVDWPEVKPADWLREMLPDGGAIGYDPRLHTPGELRTFEKGLDRSGITLQRSDNLVDRIWSDRPEPPKDPMAPYPEDLAGESSAEKRDRIAKRLKERGQHAHVITQPDNIAWLLNTRGTDLGQTPVALAFAMIEDTGAVTLFIDPEKVDDDLRVHLGNEVAIRRPADFGPALESLSGSVLVDRTTAPVWVADRLRTGGAKIIHDTDPVALAKARKNETELAGTRSAHLRDGAAVVEFLAWLAAQGHAPDLTEIDIVKRLEAFRADTGALENISFDTISGSGPNAAIVHYRVTEASDRKLATGELLLVDSGAQYRDGTTDITRTIAIGVPPPEAVHAFTLVLKGMITISRARVPKGTSGREIDALARYALWQEGMDYDHGTGHGVGVFLGVHEGPQRISRVSGVALEPGMILSNEPGYYREDAFGIRIENLIVVHAAEALPGGDERDWLTFETLTWAPIDRRLIDPKLLSEAERAWLNTYHAQVMELLAARVSDTARAWLADACAPL
ncbi:MAG: aminopeptidase P family protein [Pseudomonadota bacterium]